MNTNRKFARSFKRFYRYLLKFIAVIVLLSYLPGFLTGYTNQPGILTGVAAAGDPVIAAAGDIACDPANSNFKSGLGVSNSCRQKYTSDLLVNAGLAAVLDLGDNQYYCGSDQAFLQSYDLSWGRVKSITHPSVGNHEYLTNGGSSPSTGCDPSNAGAAGYFQYFGAAAGTKGQGYYSFDVGTWHIIALNSNCSDAGGCSASSAQYKWLQADLAAHTNFCTLAYWHIPLFSSGGRAAANSQTFWNLLYAANADLILNGHDHIYERFAPQNPTAGADTARGIREFIVGTGGSDHTTITTIASNSELRNASTFGILKLTLHPTSFDWQFIHEAGGTFTDSGTQACHGSAPTPTPTPTATLTLAPTNTPTRTLTSTYTPAQTFTPTSTLAVTNTPTQTFTPTSTLAVTNTPTQTFTPTDTLAVTNTPTQTFTPTSTLAVTNTPTQTFTPTSTLAVTNTPTPTFTPTATTSTGQSFTFNPVADAYVDSSNPSANFGSGTTFRVDGSPDVHSYLRFTVSGLGSGTITRVRLLIFANSNGNQGIKAQAVADNTWGELTLNYTNAPALGALLASSAGFTSGTWVTLDVTAYVTGNGTYSIGITDPSVTAISLAAREAGANAPQLIIDMQ